MVDVGSEFIHQALLGCSTRTESKVNTGCGMGQSLPMSSIVGMGGKKC